MCLNNIFWKQKSSCDIGAGDASKIISLRGDNSCVFVGIFGVPILTFAVDKFFNGLVGGVRLSDKRTSVSINNILFCKFIMPERHKFFFNKILNILNKNSFLFKSENVLDDFMNFLFACSFLLRNLIVGF